MGRVKKAKVVSGIGELLLIWEISLTTWLLPFLRVWEGLVADLGGDSEPRLPLRDSSCSVMLAPVTSNTTITLVDEH